MGHLVYSPVVEAANLQTRFTEARTRIETLSYKPTNDILLRLYALYKQGEQGNAPSNAPKGFDIVALAKYQAWKELSGTPAEEAQSQYIALVDQLLIEAS